MIIKRFIVKFMAFFIGCYGCFVLREQTGLTPVVSSALVGLLGSFIPFPKSFNGKGIHDAIYCGSFAGMCSLSYLSTVSSFVVISGLGSFVYLLTVPYFKGHGGKFGSMAFITFLLFLFSKGSIWNL